MNPNSPVPRWRRALWLAALLTLGGCASVPADRGLSGVQRLIAERDARLAALPHSQNTAQPELDRQVNRLLADPLTPDRAVAVALLRNPSVQLSYAQLGLAQADWLQASRLSNPVLSLSVLESDADGERSKLGYGLVQNFTDALFLRRRARNADGELAHAQSVAAAQWQALAADVYARYYAALGAQQIAQMRAVIAEAAVVSAELADRFHAAGNLSDLERARERAAAEQAMLDVEAAQAQRDATRIELLTVMGLSLDAPVTLSSGLPLPVTDETPLAHLIELGLSQRLDLQQRRQNQAVLRASAELARKLRWIPFLQVGVQGERETDGTRLLGPTLSVELPIFGRDRSGVLRTEAQLEQVQAQTELLRAAITGEIGTAYARMLAAQARAARHRDGLIPQREAIVAHTQAMQNYMLVGPFDLLLAKQQEYAAYEGYLLSLQDYWQVRVTLARAVGVALPSDENIGQASQLPVVLPDKAPDNAHQHHHHAAPGQDAHGGAHSNEQQPGGHP
ncbi:TolC family protein [Panacagrimonas sp.]|uniref:TolC family protein n=1 Tax=Panacagrimonas sp. TaxID=2480088 RepID=UPI003B52D04F